MHSTFCLQDPRLDDKVFIGTKALSESKPLPQYVRVIAGHDGGEVTNTVEMDDLIEISHAELGKDDKGNSQKAITFDQLKFKWCL